MEKRKIHVSYHFTHGVNERFGDAQYNITVPITSEVIDGIRNSIAKIIDKDNPLNVTVVILGWQVFEESE